MTHQIIQIMVSLMGAIGCVVFICGFIFVAMDVLDVYLKFREHVLNGDLAKRKDIK